MAGDVLPFVPRIERLTDEAQVPKGKPLPELWALFWRTRGAQLGGESSKKNYRRCQALTGALPDHPSPGDVVLWLASLHSMGLGPGTVSMHRDILHGVYTVAQQAGWATSHPVALAPWKRPPLVQLDPVTNMAELWPVILRVGATARERAFLGCLRFLGVRLEEALGLEVKHLVVRGDVWRVHVRQQRCHPNKMTVKPTKGRRGKGARDLPVPPQLRELLEPLREAPPVQLRFGTRGMPRVERAVPFLFPFRQQDLSKVRARLAEVAPDVFAVRKAWHQFRRARAWELKVAGKPTRVIADVLGHESEKTTEGYFGRLTGNHVDPGAFDGV